MSSAQLKKLGGVAGILVLVWIVYLYRLVPHAQTPFAAAKAPVGRVVFEKGSRKVELFKQGNDWKVTSGDGAIFAANESQIVALIAGLKDVQLEDEISDRADRAASYEVDAASGTRLRLLGDKDVNLGEGIFGKQAPDYVHLYFRYPDKPNIYLSRGMTRGELGQPYKEYWLARSTETPPSK